VQDRASPEFLARGLAGFKRRPEVTLNVALKRNDRGMLARYNRHAIEQFYERVYGSLKDAQCCHGEGFAACGLRRYPTVWREFLATAPIAETLTGVSAGWRSYCSADLQVHERRIAP
jgi:hypothetical protein